MTHTEAPEEAANVLLHQNLPRHRENRSRSKRNAARGHGHLVPSPGQFRPCSCQARAQTPKTSFSVVTVPQYRVFSIPWTHSSSKSKTLVNQIRTEERKFKHLPEKRSAVSTPSKFLTRQRVTSQHCLLCDFLQYKQKNTEMQYMNTAKCKMVMFFLRPYSHF